MGESRLTSKSPTSCFGAGLPVWIRLRTEKIYAFATLRRVACIANYDTACRLSRAKSSLRFLATAASPPRVAVNGSALDTRRLSPGMCVKSPEKGATQA